MEDVVAIRIVLSDQSERFFMTWGRVLDEVDRASLATLVRAHASKFRLGGEVAEVAVCETLHDAREAPYFYEALIRFSRTGPRMDDDYEAWRCQIRDALLAGRELYFLG
jgi:hypothetical protein